MKAKELIFKICNEKSTVRKSCPSHRNPIVADIQDICTLIERKYGPDSQLPSFYAKDFQAFPPNGFECVASLLASLRDEIAAVKEELVEVKTINQRDMKALDDVGCVRQDISDLKIITAGLPAMDKVRKMQE